MKIKLTALALALSFVPALANANPHACNGTRTAALPSATNLPEGFHTADWDLLPVGAALQWVQIRNQLDIQKHDDRAIYRLQFTSSRNIDGSNNHTDWTCADIGDSSPWFNEEVSFPILFQRSLDGEFMITPEKFVIKKHEALLSWSVNMTVALQPTEYLTGADTLNARLNQDWDTVTYLQSDVDPRSYQVIYTRVHSIPNDKDLTFTVVMDLQSTR